MGEDVWRLLVAGYTLSILPRGGVVNKHISLTPFAPYGIISTRNTQTCQVCPGPILRAGET